MQIEDCKRCGAPAVEQVRGKMGPGDYWQDRQEPGVPFPFGNVKGARDGPVRVPFHTLVEIDDSNRDDWRIACSKCDYATSWSRGPISKVLAQWNTGAHR